MPTGRRSKYTILVAATAAMALVVGACGGGDETTTTEAAKSIPLDEWVSEVNTLCVETQDNIDALAEPSGDDDFAGMITYGEAFIEEVDEFVTAVEDLGRPNERAATATRWLQMFEDGKAEVEAMIAAAEDEDSAGVDDAVTALDDLSVEQDKLADDLGLVDCMDDDSSDDTTTTTAGSGNLPLDEWSVAMDDACLRLAEKYESIGSITPETQEEVQQLANEMNSFATEIVGEFDRIGPPLEEDAAVTAQELYDLFVELQETTTAMSNAVAAGDQVTLEGTLEDVDTIGAEINPLAEEMDVPNCGGF